MLYLPTPTVANGVDPTPRGSVSVSSTNQTVTLYPGIYESISITGGTVVFQPGIYVIRPLSNTTNPLRITGGSVTANGVMFYNTGSTYDPYTGLPDADDGSQLPPASDNPFMGSVQINASIQFRPIQDTSSEFNGMLIYQRRRNTSTMTISGNSSAGQLAGTVYAKWADLDITGQGTYSAQFIVGRLTITGNGSVTVHYAGTNLGRAPAVFLVE
jgi:hypothetical protein